MILHSGAPLPIAFLPNSASLPKYRSTEGRPGDEKYLAYEEAMLLLLPVAGLLFVITILCHYECLRLISNLIARIDGVPRQKI